jgi:hypothetical protein
MSGRSLASFAAGFGTGFLNAKNKQKDDARQKKIDDRAEIEWNEKQSERKQKTDFEAKLAAAGQDAPAIESSSPAMLNGAPQMSSIDPAAPTMLPPSTTNPAASGLKEFTEKPAKPAKPMWKVMEEKIPVYLSSGKTEHLAQAQQLLELSQKMKSDEYMKKIIDAYGKGDQALLDLANSHDNGELPYTNLTAVPSEDGKSFTLSGKNHVNGEGFSETKDLGGKEVKDWLAGELISRASPESLMKHIQDKIKTKQEAKKEAREDVKFERESKKSNAELEKLTQEIKEGKIKLEILPESIQLDLKAKKANINQSNASAEASNASAAKTRDEAKGGGDKLPNSVKEALWYKDATPEQKDAFDSMNDKSPKVTADGVGGFIINKKDGMYRMDRKGEVSKVAMPDGKAKPVPKNRPPLSAFNK